jgi:hypothetical protein
VFGVGPASGQTQNVLNVGVVVDGTPPAGDFKVDADCGGMVNNLLFNSDGSTAAQQLNPPMTTCNLTVVDHLGGTVANTCTVVTNPLENFCDTTTSARFDTAGNGEITFTVTITFTDPAPAAPVVPATPTFTG